MHTLIIIMQKQYTAVRADQHSFSMSVVVVLWVQLSCVCAGEGELEVEVRRCDRETDANGLPVMTHPFIHCAPT